MEQLLGPFPMSVYAESPRYHVLFVESSEKKNYCIPKPSPDKNPFRMLKVTTDYGGLSPADREDVYSFTLRTLEINPKNRYAGAEVERGPHHLQVI